MPELARVTVALPRQPYDILIGGGLLDELGLQIGTVVPTAQVALVSDDTVAGLYADRAIKAFENSGIRVNLLTVPPGDASKSLEQTARLYDALAGDGHERNNPVVALGGGMIGDLAGFVAATWHRGVPFIQCPTTLEADIDAAIGGKTALNHPAGKNLIGAFHQPRLVLIDTDCLQSLPDRDYVAGLAESVKHAVITAGDFLSWHETHVDAICRRDPAAVIELIRRNCEIKSAVVVADERESDFSTDGAASVGRAALNFGHTIGHAIEAQADYQLRHGECVALGMVAALDLAVRLLQFPAAGRDRIVTLLAALGLPTRSPIALDETLLLRRLQRDKKNRSGRTRFVLPVALGQVLWCEDPPEKSLRDSIGLLHN